MVDPSTKGRVNSASGVGLSGAHLDSCIDAVFVLDHEGRILDANRAVVSRYGYTRENLLSMTAADLAPVRLHPRVAGNLQAAIREGTVFE